MIKNEELEDYIDFVDEWEKKVKSKLDYFFGAYDQEKKRRRSILKENEYN